MPRKPAESPATSPLDLLRVRDGLTGHEYTCTRGEVAVDPDRYTVLDGPTVGPQGRPLPPSTPDTADLESNGAANQAADNPVTA